MQTKDFGIEGMTTFTGFNMITESSLHNYQMQTDMRVDRLVKAKENTAKTISVAKQQQTPTNARTKSLACD